MIKEGVPKNAVIEYNFIRKCWKDKIIGLLGYEFKKKHLHDNDLIFF